MPKITSISQFSKFFARKWLGEDPEAYGRLASELESELEQHFPDMVGHGVLTREAFEKLMKKRKVHEELGITSGQVRAIRYQLKNNMPIKASTMEELLRTAGYEKVQEQKWRKE